MRCAHVEPARGSEKRNRGMGRVRSSIVFAGLRLGSTLAYDFEIDAGRTIVIGIANDGMRIRAKLLTYPSGAPTHRGLTKAADDRIPDPLGFWTEAGNLLSRKRVAASAWATTAAAHLSSRGALAPGVVTSSSSSTLCP